MEKKRKSTVLVADDETINFMYLEEILLGLKFDVLIAKNGKEAVELFGKNQDTVGLILMDLKMPVMNGFDALKEIRKTNPDIPVIAQTAFAMKPDKDKALQAGFNDYLAKPIRKLQLVETIYKYMGDFN